MMQSASISLEALKLKLIQNHPFADQTGQQVILSKEAIKYLIKALEYADASFASDIETVLTKAGVDTVPALVKGLSSQNNTVKSTCAMVLIRLGEPVVEAVKQFYIRNAHRNNLNWVGEFILSELGEPLPQAAIALPELTSNIRTLERVG